MLDETRGTTGDRQGVPTGGVLIYTTRNTQKQTSEDSVNLIQSFINSIVDQESGGNYNAYNPYSGAKGKYQFMPETWESLSQELFGYVADMSPANQDAVALHYFQKAFDSYISMGADTKKALEAMAVSWYAGPQNGERWVRGEPYAMGENGPYSWDATQGGDHPSVRNYAESVLARMGDIITTEPVRIVEEEVAKVVQDNLKNVSDLSNVRFFSMSEATDEKGTIKILDQTKEQKKALDEFYKRQSQINKAVQEYNTYMGASKLKLDEINGNFTEYREKVLEVRSEFAKTAEQAQKLVGQGLSREDANKMIDRAKEVAEAILKEFERVRKIEFEIDFKTNQSKIAELNHDIEKSLILRFLK